jgi:hypothetical protein
VEFALGIALRVRWRAAGGAALALGLAGCADMQAALWQWGWVPPGSGPALLACYGDFAQFANKAIVARLSELKFVVDWATPSVTPLNGGGPAYVIALNALELSFDVPYEGYRAAYHLDRVGGVFSQRPSPGGVYFGRCELRPLTTQF